MYIQASGDKLMMTVEELNEWMDVDISHVVDDLKRITIIETDQRTYTIAELIDKNFFLCNFTFHHQGTQDDKQKSDSCENC